MRVAGSLFRKLLLTAFALVAVAVAVIDYFVTDHLAEREVLQVQQRLAVDAALVAPGIPTDSSGGLDAWAVRTGQLAKARVTLIRADGKVVGESQDHADGMENHAGRDEVRAALQGRPGMTVRRSATLDRDFCYVAIPVAGNPQVAVLRLAVPLEEVKRATSAVRRRLAYVSFLILAAGLALSFLLSQRFSARVERLKAFAEGVLDRRGAEPIRVDTLDELGSLGQSLNRMAGELGQNLRALKVEAESRETILTSMREGVLAVDADLRVTFGNPALARSLGVAYPLPTGTPIRSLIRDPALAGMLANVQSTKQAAGQRIALAGNELRSFQIHAVPFGDATNPGVLAILHDITDLEKLERIRKDFVSNVSHELRTPLASIQGYSETLLDGALDDKETAHRFVETIRANAIRLNDIAADLLSLAELESGNAAATEPVSLRSAINSAVRTVAAEAKQREVEVRVEPGDDAVVVASRLRLEQALINLLTNAVKFNRPGGTVDVALRAGGGSVEIRIQDTGIGIPSKDLPRIFERFFRVDRARSRAMGGTGLGLSIVKHSIESMGGRVQAESEMGQGSTFTITLPAQGNSAG